MKEIINSKLFVQIGLPKTATTTLQREIYPLLCKHTKYSYWREDPTLEHLIATAKYKGIMGFECEKIEIPDFTLISLESLIYYDPRRWESQANSNKIIFGEDAHIFITLREPRSYLTSIYTETCLHSGLAHPPEHFFLSENECSDHFLAPAFSIDEFSYQRLINIYTERFKTVTVVKFEELSKLEFINDFFDVDDIQFENMKSRFKVKRFNRGFSERMVKNLLFLSRVLGLAGLSFGKHTNNASVNLLRDGDRLAPQESSRGRIKLLVNFFKRNLKRLKRLAFSNFKIPTSRYYWYLVLKIIDKLFPSRKFKLDFDKLNYINIDKLDAEYLTISDYKTYSRE